MHWYTLRGFWLQLHIFSHTSKLHSESRNTFYTVFSPLHFLAPIMITAFSFMSYLTVYWLQWIRRKVNPFVFANTLHCFCFIIICLNPCLTFFITEIFDKIILHCMYGGTLFNTLSLQSNIFRLSFNIMNSEWSVKSCLHYSFLFCSSWNQW